MSFCKGLAEYLPAPDTWETYLACLIVLVNLCEVFGCSIVADFKSIIFRLSIDFGC